ncbi:MAG: accessory Sec system translocase SecA2 [Candidatus Aminicenantes bacterium]
MIHEHSRLAPGGHGARLRTAFDRFRGVSVETGLTHYARAIRDIHACHAEAELAARSDADLAGLAASLKEQLQRPVPAAATERARIEAFGLVFEAARRALGLAAHDVQLAAGLAMSADKLAELPTGEGKTLAAVFAASFLALSGRPVHVLTFNDYLARRDAAWMGPVYRLIGLSVGVVQEGLSKAAKRLAYASDITYATAKEAGFDYLRDRLSMESGDLVHRPFGAALIDEADSILIDEARIPLVISGVVGQLGGDAGRAAGVVRDLVPGRDYEVDDKKQNVFPTDAGIRSLESALGCGNLFAPENGPLLAEVHCALHARALLERDVDYIVRGGRIEIVDEFTGRVMDERHWPDGLQAAVEAKENVRGRTEGRTLGSVTLQHFLRLYPHLSGMTATARPSAREFKEFYGLSVVVIPPHRPCIRQDLPDLVFTHREAKRRALVAEIASVHGLGRPILVGTSSVRESEELAAALRSACVACEVLNAKNDELEARVVARAGTPGAVTISTNMAGRGTDIKLGGPHEEQREQVAALGGLYVIGTNRHESLRIDSQLRGRAGRQGDPGTSRFFISLEDDIFVRYGLGPRFFSRHRLSRRDDPVDSQLLRKEIAHGQRVIEGRNLDIRRSLWDYSTLIETQRRIIAEWRDAVFETPLLPDAPFQPQPALIEAGSVRFGREPFTGLVRRVALLHIDRLWADHLAWLADLRESIHLVALGRKEPLLEFQRSATDTFLEIEREIDRAVSETLSSLIAWDGPVDLEREGLKGPSSTWTYLVNEDQFGWGVEMLKGTNVGFSAVAAALYGPLYIFALVANRLKRKKSE